MRNLIFGLARPMLRVLRRDERGAVGVLVAILIGCGVITGIAALVIDVGQIYQNRAELQNGADAAALAVAKSCVTGTCQPGIAGGYADANASALTNGMAGIRLVCGSGILGACPAPTGVRTDCPAPPAGVTGYVDVHTETQTPSGNLLPPVFARTLLGNSSYAGTTVGACAQASWGGPSVANTIAFTISACQWDGATGLGQNFAPPPPAVPASSFDQKIVLHGKSSNFGCPTEPAGADGPGNFDWTTSNPKGACSLQISGLTYGGKPGVSDPGCKAVLTADYQNHTVVFIPVYVTENVQGSTGAYTLKGFAAFVITGFGLPGASEPDWLNPANNCSGSTKCIDGYFTQALVPTTGVPTGPDLGASVIALTG